MSKKGSREGNRWWNSWQRQP